MSAKWYWILILSLENAYTPNVRSQIQTKLYRLICNLPSDLCEDWSHSLTVPGHLFHWLWHHPPVSARRWPVIDVGPALDRPASLPGRWRVAGRGLYVNCSLHSNMQNISISVKTIIIIIITRYSPLSKHWPTCFKLSPTLSALWTQHCSVVKKEQPYNVCHSSRTSYTRIPQRDW